MNKIINGDCVDILQKIPDNSVDAVISDIPYGIGYADWDVIHNNTNSAFGGSSESQRKKGGLYKRRGKPLNGWSEADKQISKEYEDWCSVWGAECFRVMKPGASCFIFAGRRYAHRCTCALEDIGFTFKDMIAWEKPKAPHRAQRLSAIYERRGDTDSAEAWRGWRVANPKPIFEPILWFQKPYKLGGTIADNVLKYDVGAWNEEAIEKYNIADNSKLDSNVIATKICKTDHGLHPTQKPLSLMKCLIELVTVEGQLILDPFCGSGTTCLAAKHLNRDFIGIEKDENMANTAYQRVGCFSV